MLTSSQIDRSVLFTLPKKAVQWMLKIASLYLHDTKVRVQLIYLQFSTKGLLNMIADNLFAKYIQTTTISTTNSFKFSTTQGFWGFGEGFTVK